MQNTVVSQTEWLAARKALLAKQKELTRARDRISAELRALPWVQVDKNYVFDTTGGKKSLADLFGGRSQLIVYHFMWRADLDDGCVGCSFLCDHLDGVNLHLPHNDVTLIVASRAPLATLQNYKKRMGWEFDWVSSDGSDFNYDYHVSFTKDELASGKVFYNFQVTDAAIEELSGTSVFYKAENGDVYHTYSSYSRGDEEVIGTYMWLDIVPKGRNENGPAGNLTDWVRHHDRYGIVGRVDATGAFRPDETVGSCCHPAANKESIP